MKSAAISFAFLLTLALVSCGPVQTLPKESPIPNLTSTLPPESVAVATSLLTTVEPVQSTDTAMENIPFVEQPFGIDKFIELAKQDLAQRLNIDTDQISLVKTADITWSDITSGCNPQPGQILTQGSLTGYRIWLEADGQEYIYHASLKGQLIFCQDMKPGANNPLLSKTPGATQHPPETNP